MRTKLENSYLLHSDSKIFVVATTGSKNAKTGDMIQLWILDATMHPSESRKSGHDALNQCAGCPLASNNGCYVIDNPLITIAKKHARNGYKPLAIGTPEFTRFFKGRAVRFGAYGNPSLIPLPMVEAIAGLARRWTGYFHDWHVMTPEKAQAYGRYFMASCETKSWQKAQALGLRTFTTCSTPEDVKGSGIECLADSKNLQCAECGLCDGTNRRAGKLPSVWIKVHGRQTRKAAAVTLAN